MKPTCISHRRFAKCRQATLALLLSTIITQQSSALAQSYSIDWHEVAGGGGLSTNGQYSSIGTIGQPDASGAMKGGIYSVTGGFWSLYAIQTPGAPWLAITYSGGQAIVSWPSPSPGFLLQTNSNLATGTWGNFDGIVGDSGTIKKETNAPPAGTLFFRLKHP
jgi:hypothetical protein